jgi:signal transduction histidine kinase
LEQPQTRHEGKEKSQGRSDSTEETPDTPAQEHGSDRANSGFSLAAMVSEYRALRASVLRLWIGRNRKLDSEDVVDLIRFNEAIDQALAESTGRFMNDVDLTRETFLGILGHDLRTPLGAIITSARFLLDLDELSPTTRALIATIASSGSRMNLMVNELLDFTRGRLGVSMPITRTRVDLARIIRTSVEEIAAAHPGVEVSVDISGDLSGEWDSVRMSQVLSNLMGNAITHGSPGTRVTVRARGEADRVVFSVHNQATPIPAGQLQQIFDPFSSGSLAARDSNHLGLGLYIVQEIVVGHGGTIEAESNELEGTTFTVRLPRSAS